MHLFIIEHYTNLDNLAPVIHKIANNGDKVFVCGTHPVKSYENDRLVNFLTKNKNITYKQIVPLSLKDTILYKLIKLVSLLPKNIICKRNFWTFIAKKLNFINKEKIFKFVKKNNILSITIDDTLLKTKQVLLKEIAIKANIPLIIFFPSWFGHIYNQKKFNLFSADLSNINIISNKLPGYDFKKDNYKNYFLGMPRYNLEWLKVLEKINPPIEKSMNHKTIKIAAFSNTTQRNYEAFKIIINKLNSYENIDILERNKPKDNLPEKCSSFQSDEFSTTQVIDWCDVIIFNMNSSIFVEALLKKKKIIYIKSIDDFHDRTIDDNYLNKKNIFYKVNDFDDLKKFLNDTNNDIYHKSDIDYSEIINEITSNNSKNLSKFLELYKELSNDK